MKLELVSFPVREVKFGKQTAYREGVLEIDKEELIALVLQDKKIASAGLDVAFPGDHTRITFVRGVVEPRVKVSGPGCVFPGILGPVETVGEGRTHRLSGFTVMASAQYQTMIKMGISSGTVGLVDMWGPGAEVTPFGSLINLVLVLKLVNGVTELEAHSAIELAQFNVAHRLAETTRDKTSERVDVFELFDVDPSLPRIVYNLCFISQRVAPHSGIAFYGFPVREGLPIFIHPNELLEGAVTPDARTGAAWQPQCWAWMNHPIVLRLMKEHGKRLNFLGVILQRTSFETELGKKVSAASASQMARLMRADGAILTGMCGVGNIFIGAAMTLQAYEKKGIKTVMLHPEQGGEVDRPLVFYAPEADAMVSTGELNRALKLLVPAKVIGCEPGQLIAGTPGEPASSPWSGLTLDKLHAVTEGADWWGRMNLTCRLY